MTKNTQVTLTQMRPLDAELDNSDKHAGNGKLALSLDTSSEAAVPDVGFEGTKDGKLWEDKYKEAAEGEEEEEDEAGAKGCCGRKKRKEDMEMVGALELFRFATGFDKLLILLGSLAAVGQGTTMPINMALFGEVIDLLISEENDNTTASNSTKYDELDEEIMPYVYGFLGVSAGCFICSFLSVWCWSWAAERQVNEMRKQFFHAVMRQDIGWFDFQKSGEISSRFSEDVSKISEGIGDKMAVFIQWITTWISAYIMAFTRDWKLTLTVALMSPVLIAVGAIIVKVMRNLAVQEFKAYAKAGTVAEQTFRAIRTVQAFQGQEKEIQKYDENLTLAVTVASKKGLALGLGTSVLWFFVFANFAVVMWLGTYLVQEENLAPGIILPVYLAILLGSFHLGNAFNNLECFSNARAAATKVFNIISLEPVIDSSSDKGLRPIQLEGHLQFKDIEFRYPARAESTVLKNLSLEVLPGQHVALVGPSGCGKSTIIQLLQRFYDPVAGQVMVDGKDIKDLNLKWLRSQIGVVSQEPVLFDASIEENIRFGKIDATIEEIHQAAKEANAHDFIQLLPEGYKTNVGERGAQLSGGQKQRISIARALVRNPKILLMDEATSALDHESEAIVQSALDKAGIGRTTITIAHRLSTVIHADKIVAISEGEVMEEGTHDELMERQGLYFELVQIQAKINKESEVDIADVEIVEEDDDAEIRRADDELLRGSFKRTLSGQSDPQLVRQVSLIARDSIRKAGKKPQKKRNQEEGREENIPMVKLSQIMRYSASEWPLIMLGCFSAILSGGIHPSFSFLMSEYVKLFRMKDEDDQMEMTHILSGTVLGIAAFSAIIRIFQGFCLSKSGAILTARLRKLTFASIINQDMEYFDQPQNQVGAITTKLASDAALVQGAAGSKVGLVLESLSTLGCAIVIAFVFGWKLALVILPFLPFMVISGILQGQLLAGAAKKDKIHIQQAGKLCSEVVDNIRTVTSLHREDYFMHVFDGLINNTNKSNKKIAVVCGLTHGIGNSLVYISYAVGFYYGSTLIRDGEMEFYDVFRVFAAVIFGGRMIGRQSTFGSDYTKAKLAASRIIADIHRKPKVDVTESAGAKIGEFEGSISLVNAVYHYSTRPNIPVLDGMNLTISPGETVALVGASGCGKSTTTQIVQRFYNLDEGSVLADGHNLTTVNLRWYRQQIGVVSQEPTLFDCSIAENIAYGDNSRVVQMEEIVQAARDANIHNFVSSLPQGYDTNVGDKGTQLSGGQKQRIAIARALLRNPKILLLDEATSALDSESEKVVQEALDRASEHRTCIVIAHRLSTIQNADKIAVVSRGKVVETGTHTQLMTIKGAYYRLLKAQKRPHKV